MNANERQHLFEVDMHGLHDNIYVIADERHEVVQTLGERYDNDRFNLDWEDFVIVAEDSRSPKDAVSGGAAPFLVLWNTEENGVRGLESRTNMSGSNSLYWI